MKPQKSLGQHWLKDPDILNKIADYADLTSDDTVLEIGPGLGTLTAVLAQKAGRVIAVEFDKELALKLAGKLASEFSKSSKQVSEDIPVSSLRAQRSNPESRVQSPESKISVINADFLQFDLNQLPAGYKVVANIPYYITGKIIEKLLTAENKPSVAVLLVQKEVAERVSAKPGGDMSLLSVVAQYYADIELGIIVPANKFTPPPKVDSQVIIMRPYAVSLRAGRSQVTLDRHVAGAPRDDTQEKQLFHIVKAGFSQRRKKLRTSLAGGLNISVAEAEKMLKSAGIDPNLRAQDLTIEQWCAIMVVFDD